MDDFSRKHIDEGVIITAHLTRATLKEAFELKKLVEAELIYRHYKLVIDLSECEFIDSTFLGTLVFAHKKYIGKQGRLNVILHFRSNRDLFYVTNTLSVLNIYESLDEAVTGLNNYDNLPIVQVMAE